MLSLVGYVALLARPAASARLGLAPAAPLQWVGSEWFVTPTRTFLAFLFDSAFIGVVFGLVLLFVLFLVHVLVKNQWLAVGILAAIVSAYGLADPSPLLAWLTTSVAWACAFVTLLRFGLVGYLGSSALIMSAMPLTTDLSAWYAGVGIAGLLVFLAFAATGFVISLGGRPMFGRMALEE